MKILLLHDISLKRVASWYSTHSKSMLETRINDSVVARILQGSFLFGIAVRHSGQSQQIS